MSRPAIPFTAPTTSANTAFPHARTRCFSSGWCWKSIRPACPLTVLKKRAAFATAFDGFDIDKVAAYGAREKRRLLADSGIIRNRLKIEAVIENARRLQRLHQEHGSFAAWLDSHHPMPLAEWVKLFKKTFRFTGGEIVGEFLMSLGYLPGAHAPSCPVGERIIRLSPPWMTSANLARR